MLAYELKAGLKTDCIDRWFSVNDKEEANFG